MSITHATVLIGVIAIGAVAGPYFWPSNVGVRCPGLTMTSEEIQASSDMTELHAADRSMRARSSCLDSGLVTVLQESWPSQLSGVERAFKRKHLRRWQELSSELASVQAEVQTRVRELELEMQPQN